MSYRPRVSVVVPTRDRPDLLTYALEGLACQTYEDLEVVVADNATTLPARDVVDRWSGDSWQYVVPPDPLEMHENFEFACAAATGEYVAVVIDKTVLHPGAIETAVEALAVAPDPSEVDVVSWWSEGFDPSSETRDPGRGTYRPSFAKGAATKYAPHDELVHRFSMARPRGLDGEHYFRGKIVFGMFSRSLLDRISTSTGRVFAPLAPDYTSMVPALVHARVAIDVGRPLLVSYNSTRSNGRLQTVDPAHARQFIERTDPSILDRLPIPGLYTSLHNVVAYDLVTAAGLLPAGATPELDRANLVRRAREDLALMQWVDDAEREAQFGLLADAERAAGVEPMVVPDVEVATPTSARSRLTARLFGSGGPLEQLVYRVKGLPLSRAYPSPVAAARAADEHYS